jgi:histone-binding protein RBBP4
MPVGKPSGVPGAGREAKKEKIVCDQEINHQGEVNKARYMPQSHNLVATKTVSGEVHVFDVFKHTTRPVDKQVRPTLRLTGHKSEGYGLSWNPLREGLLLSGSDDGLLAIWDIN